LLGKSIKIECKIELIEERTWLMGWWNKMVQYNNTTFIYTPFTSSLFLFVSTNCFADGQTCLQGRCPMLPDVS
jgi:hypothetical protein